MRGAGPDRTTNGRATRRVFNVYAAMAYRIALAPELADLVGGLSTSVLRRIDAQLESIAELAEGMPPEAPCWQPFRTGRGRDAQRLHFYAGDCCVHFELQPDTRCVWVTGLARIRLGLDLRRDTLPVQVERA
jgi:hypothetical protein